MPLRFLDIDLDAFVHPTAYWPEGGRLPDEDHETWPEGRLRRFLEMQCGLRTTKPIPGVLVENHDEAFDVLASLNAYERPVDLTHVDAHADLGMGDPSWVYLHRTLMREPMKARGAPLRGTFGLNLGSWLAYAVAAGWLSAVTFVHPEEGAQDLPPIYFRDADPATGLLELKCYSETDLGPETPDYWDLVRAVPASTDAPVPFSTVNLDAFAATAQFDRALLCRSPDYTPPAADLLIPIISEYIEL